MEEQDRTVEEAVRSIAMISPMQGLLNSEGNNK